jgi:phosphate transport system substrate-binding protein
MIIRKLISIGRTISDRTIEHIIIRFAEEEVVKHLKKDLVVIVLALVVVFLGWGGKGLAVEPASPKKTVTELRGMIRISGAWALYPMMVRWAEEYKRAYPNMRIDVSAGGAGKGVTDTLASFVDIGMVSRDIKAEEVARGIVFVPVTKDAVFPVMNVKNPVASKILAKGINKKVFEDLWIQGSPVTWGKITDTGSNDKIQVYTRSDACGAAETWALYLGEAQEDLKGTGVYSDPGISEAVLKDINGVGYNNLNYAYDMKTGKPIAGLLVIPIDVNGNGKIDTAEDLSTKDKAIRAVRTRVYPSPPARDLFLVAKNEFKGLSAHFVNWILTDGQRFVDEVGYIKLTDIQIKNARKLIGK